MQEAEFTIRQAAKALRIRPERLSAMCDDGILRPDEFRISWGLIRRRIFIKSRAIDRLRREVLPRFRALYGQGVQGTNGAQ